LGVFRSEGLRLTNRRSRSSEYLDGLNGRDTVGEALLKAHDDLQKAVNDKSRQFQSLVSSLAEFADKAAAVQKAFTTNPPAPAAK
jgi:hypothetical protein